MSHKQGFPKIDDRMRKASVAALKRQSAPNQVKIMADLLHSGKLSHEKLKSTLEGAAPAEMRKGINKLVLEKKPVTVENLLEEYHGDKPFQDLALEVGLDNSYFVNLAEQEMKKRGIIANEPVHFDEVVEPKQKERKGVSKFFWGLVHGD